MTSCLYLVYFDEFIRHQMVDMIKVTKQGLIVRYQYDCLLLPLKFFKHLNHFIAVSFI